MPRLLRNRRPTKIQLLNVLKDARRQLKSRCKRGTGARRLQPKEVITLERQVKALVQQRHRLYPQQPTHKPKQATQDNSTSNVPERLSPAPDLSSVDRATTAHLLYIQGKLLAAESTIKLLLFEKQKAKVNADKLKMRE